MRTNIILIFIFLTFLSFAESIYVLPLRNYTKYDISPLIKFTFEKKLRKKGFEVLRSKKMFEITLNSYDTEI